MQHPQWKKKKRWEHNEDLLLLIFFFYFLSNRVSCNTGIIGITDILKIRHSRGVEKKTERLSEIFFFLCLIHKLSGNYFWNRYWLFFFKSSSHGAREGHFLDCSQVAAICHQGENIQYPVAVEDFDQRRSLAAKMGTSF